MRRNPAIHVRLGDFISVLTSLGIDNPDKTAMAIFKGCVPFSITDRHVITTKNKVITHRVQRVLDTAKTSAMTVERFNRILDACRREVGHRHVSPIRKGSSQFLMLKEIAYMACEFASRCGIESMDEGCKTYVMLGLGFMRHSNTYGLNKFKTYDDAIYREYESIEMIANDPKPKRTAKFHSIYKEMLLEYAGIERDLSKPVDYVCFVYTRLEADNAGATMEDWLRAQFEELHRIFDSIPSPRQLFSDNAIKRYYDYMKSTKRMDIDEEEITVGDWANAKTDFEKRYAEKLRKKNAES